ncbi:MAG TPA: hypothetical protein VFM82_03530 [Flavobacteriaceae bacterium]|nr:hypothetical protein [Flavobacteriaceae bacterium]
MANNIDLGSFTFDAQAVDAQLESLKKQLFDLKQEQAAYRNENKLLNKSLNDLNKEQQELIQTGQQQSKTYQENQKQIANLNRQKETLFKKELKTKEALSSTQKEYKETSRTIDMLTDANGNRVQSSQAVNVALEREVRSIDQARQSNKELLALRNKLDLATDEGVVAMEKLNDKLNENNQFVKENVSGYEQQKINIGNYEGAVEGALGPLGEFLTVSQEAGGIMPLLSAGLASARTALLGVTKAAIGFIATPIGAVIALLAAGFLLVRNAMNRSEETTNKISKAFSVFGGFISKILELLEPLGEFIVDGLVKGLELLEESFYLAMEGMATALEFLGFDETAASVRDFKTEIQETADAARDLEQAEQDLEKAQRKQRLTQLQYQKEAEKYRQIRDDETLTIQQRMQANEDLAEVLDKQLQTEKALAEQALLVANLRIKQDGETKAALDAQYVALTEIADIEERITGQRSEQLQNQNSLRNEQIALIEEQQQAAIDQSKAELDLFIAQQGYRARTLQEELELAEQVKNKKIEILEQELAAGNITRTEYQAQQLTLNNEFLQQQAEASLSHAERELQIFKDAHQSRIENGEFLNQTLFEQEQARLNQIAQAERDFQAQRLQEGVINEQEYNDAINAINEENRIAQDELRAEREAAQKEKEAIDLENKRIAEEEGFISQFELEAQRLEQQRLQEVAAAEATGASITQINAKYAKLQEDVEQAKQQNKIALASQTLGAISDVLGQQSAVGKAVAIAQATIDTYMAANNALSTLPPPFSFVAAAATVAAGLINVKKIVSTKPPNTSTKPPKAERGRVIRGKRHSQGGELIEAEEGERIINRKSSAMFPELLSEINMAGGGIPLAARGYSVGNAASESAVVQSRVINSLGLGDLSETISQSVREGAMQGSASGTAQGSQAGLIGLSDNRQIQRSSAF